jgi:hypothetical protein
LPSLGHWDMQERHVFTSQGQETYPTHLMRIWSASFWRAPQLSATAICCHGFGPQYFSILGRELSPGHEELRILGTRTSSQPLCSRWCRQPPQRDVTASVGRTSRSKMSPQLQGWGFHLSSSIYIYLLEVLSAEDHDVSVLHTACVLEDLEISHRARTSTWHGCNRLMFGVGIAQRWAYWCSKILI